MERQETALAAAAAASFRGYRHRLSLLNLEARPLLILSHLILLLLLVAAAAAAGAGQRVGCVRSHR